MADKYKVVKPKDSTQEHYVRGPTAAFEHSFDQFGTYSGFKEKKDAEKAADLCNLAYEQGMKDARAKMRGAMGL